MAEVARTSSEPQFATPKMTDKVAQLKEVCKNVW